MNIQKSFAPVTNYDLGILYLVATPIGNLEDMTYRAIRILKEVDWIAAEDTRITRKLLAHYDIHTRLVSYHEHNKQTSGTDLIAKLMEGNHIALVSDAGLPAIADPGFEVVKAAIDHNIRVVPIPGANAALTALIVSGLMTSHFLFFGFLPRGKKDRQTMLENMSEQPATLICYESPHRLVQTLKHMHAVWGDRRIVLARELTKKFEEIARGTITEALELLQEQPAKGEYCLVIEGKQDFSEGNKSKALWWALLSVEAHYEYYINEGIAYNEAMRQVAADRQVSRRDIYHILKGGAKG